MREKIKLENKPKTMTPKQKAEYTEAMTAYYNKTREGDKEGASIELEKLHRIEKELGMTDQQIAEQMVKAIPNGNTH